jgi:hypothetical protein
MADLSSISAASSTSPTITAQDQQDLVNALIELKTHSKEHHGAHGVKSLDPFNSDNSPLPSGADLHDLITQLNTLLASAGAENSNSGSSNQNTASPIPGTSN